MTDCDWLWLDKIHFRLSQNFLWITRVWKQKKFWIISLGWMTTTVQHFWSMLLLPYQMHVFRFYSLLLRMPFNSNSHGKRLGRNDQWIPCWSLHSFVIHCDLKATFGYNRFKSYFILPRHIHAAFLCDAIISYPLLPEFQLFYKIFSSLKRKIKDNTKWLSQLIVTN